MNMYVKSEGAVTSHSYNLRFLDIAYDWADRKALLISSYREVDEDGAPVWFVKLQWHDGRKLHFCRVNAFPPDKMEDEAGYRARAEEILMKMLVAMKKPQQNKIRMTDEEVADVIARAKAHAEARKHRQDLD